MFTKTTTALCAAFVLTAACLGPAAAKNRPHHRAATVHWTVPTDAYNSYGSDPASPVGPAVRIREPAYMSIQTQGFHNGG